MSQFEIKKAERKRLKARIGISGPSGSGKTYSAILLMRGLVGKDGRFCVIDTEQESSAMYSHLAGGFDVLTLDPPYSPQRYMAALDAIEEAGYDGCVIDQISQAWAGQGGILEFVDRQKTASGNKAGFAGWKEATPIQHAFVERMLRFKGHLVVTMRSKVEWVVEKDEKGRNTPRKVGMSPVQREGIEYEFQLMLDLTNDGNYASVSKDRTSLLYGQVFKVEVDTGAKIRAFLDSGALTEDKPAPIPAPHPADSELVELVSPSEAKLIVTTGRANGLSIPEIKEVVKAIAGVDESKLIPKAKFAAILAALSPNGDSAVA